MSIRDKDQKYTEPPILDRLAVSIKIKQPFVEWANSLPDNSGENITIEDFQSPTVFLIPAYETESGLKKFLNSALDEIFEQQLNSWSTDRSLWPRNISPTVFNEWFDVEISDMVFDLHNEPIKRTFY